MVQYFADTESKVKKLLTQGILKGKFHCTVAPVCLV